MTELAKKKRPEFRNLNLFNDVRTYRLPLAGIISILHRLSGMLMFILLPLVIWMFDTSVSSEISFGRFSSAFTAGLGFVPGWLIKLVTLALIWSYLHHLAAGVRHLYLDVSHKTTKDFGRQSAAATLVFSVGLTLILGAKLFGLY
ncbi:MAG: succinate dehydrogenase, cytochrome b556 subunit [Burkholderiaceae bacterium]|nr:succinate dehydrogenase, cytochrome b556 subunit [Burkholderiaceae bacterium]